MHTECMPRISLHLSSYPMWRMALAFSAIEIIKTHNSLVYGVFLIRHFQLTAILKTQFNYTMKLYLSLLLAFSAINSVLADEATCNKDAALVNQHKGEKYTQEIVLPAQSLLYIGFNTEY